MKRLSLAIATLLVTGVLGACGSGEVVVQAQRHGDAADAEPQAIANLTVRLLPYDRDVIFDSLQAAFPEPEPAIPDTLVKLQEAVALAQEEWKTAESQWNSYRDSLKVISTRLQGMSRAQPAYVALFKDFESLEPQVNDLQRRMDSAFARFTALQGELVAQSGEIRAQRDEWADRAFEPVDDVIVQRLEELKRPELADTTDAAGVALFKLKPGKWWVYARYEEPYSELYWNVPVEVTRGEPVQVRLSRENAQLRRKL